MKKLLLVLAVSLAVMGCDEFYYAAGVIKPNFDSATGSNRGLLVANETQENLVAFHGSVARENLIGGVRATESNHYFSLNVKENPNPGAFNHTHDFILVLVKNEDYKTYFFNLEEAPVFAQIYVSYNKDTVSTYKYTISKNLGGKGTLRVHNMSEMNADLRLNGINGVSIGYAPAQQSNTYIQLEPDKDYELYVVFRRYSPKLNETVTYYPTFTDKDGKEIPVYYAFSIEDSIVDIDLKEEFVQINPENYSFDYAYLQVINNFNQGIKIRNGMTTLATSKGIETLNAGDNYSFQLNLAKSGATSAIEQDFSALQIVSGPLRKEVEKITMKPGFIYPISVSGTVNTGISYELKEPYPINLDDIFAEE